jgi:hypothetical protein
LFHNKKHCREVFSVSRKLYSSLLCPSEKVTEEQIKTDAAIVELGQSMGGLNRRGFLSSLAAATAAAAATGLLGSATPARAITAAGPSIVDVFNFALNLEYLEANLYLSASGLGLVPAVLGGGAPVKGAPGYLQSDPDVLATTGNLAGDETRHITVLRAAIIALGGTPISQPAIDYTLGGKMTITTSAQLLAVARQFTSVGVSAYAGAAQYLVSNPEVLTAAAQILGAESQHNGALNYLCNTHHVMSPPVDALDVPPVQPDQFTTLTPTTDTTGPALGIPRTTQQVLGIVYGVSMASTTTPPSGVTSGGFFPNGLNGAIKST